MRENAQHPLPLAEQMPAIAGQLSVDAELARDPRWRRRLPPLGRATGLSDEDRAGAWSESLAERLAAPELPSRLYAATGWWRQRARMLP